ncbi:hypothetical protein BKA81DRAFT_182266 [Phyllosticta paracitricarpa]
MATSSQDHEKAPQAATAPSLATSREISLEDEPAPVVSQPAAAAPASPNGGHGWVCCFAIFWINAHTWGINSASLPSESDCLPIQRRHSCRIDWRWQWRRMP